MGSIHTPTALAAFHLQDAVLYIARAKSTKTLHVIDVCSPEELETRVGDLVANQPLELLTTEYTEDRIKQLAGTFGNFTVQVLPYLTAIYQSYLQEVGAGPCIVLSMKLDSGDLGYFSNGSLEIRSEMPGLSLRECWKRFVVRRGISKAIQKFSKRYPDVGDDVFRDFLDALRGDVGASRRGPIPFAGRVNLGDSVKEMAEALAPFSQKLDSQKHLILSNWAAYGNLPQLLGENGYVVHMSSDSPFQDAVRGLIVWRSRQRSEAAVDKAAKESQARSNRERDLKGKSDEVVLECLSCGTNNRISHWPEKKVAVCGSCKAPLPPVKVQHVKDALAKGAYDNAAKYCEELLREDKRNKLFQALWLLANVKMYKSVEGYEKKVKELRDWSDLGADVKPWVKEILTLAGKEDLEKGEIESAEQNLTAGYKIDPSGEVPVLLAKVKQVKGDLALRKGDLQQAQAFYKEATIKDPSNEDYPRYLSQVTELIESQHAKKRRVLWAAVILVAIVVVGIWLGRKGEKVSPPTVVTIASSRVDADKQELKVNERVKLRFIAKYSDGREAEITKTVEWQSSDVSVATVSQEGEVKGLKVGRADITAHYGGLASPPLSLFVTDERPPEEVASPGGSLKTKEEPGTAVVALEKIEDHIKVARRERDNGRYADAIAELEKARSLDPSNAEVLRELEITRRAWDAEKNILGDKAPAEKSLPKAAQTEPAETWSYEVVRAAYVFERPWVSSTKVARVDKGTKITVVRSIGDWLEVRSKHGKPPGFIRREDAKYVGTTN